MIIRKDEIPLEKSFPFMLDNVKMEPFANMGQTYHWHDCLEISYVKSGYGRYYIEEKVYEMGPGDIIILNNVEPHYLEVYDEGMLQPVIVFDPSLIWSRDSLALDYEYLKPFFDRGTDFSNKLDLNNPFAAKIKEHLEAIENEYAEKPEGYFLMIKARLLVILTYLIRHFRDDSKTENNNSSKRLQLLKIEEALKYILQNFDTNLKLEEVASKLYITPQYFSTLFKKVMGMNFLDYVNKIRTNHAIRLLTETDTKITHIAMECGFNNTATFNSIFKKYTGKTPSEYR